MATTQDMSIEYQECSALIPSVQNSRLHSKKQIRAIMKSIETYGWTNPILVDEDNGVLAGHGRLRAAQMLQIDRVPTVRLSNMTEAQKRAYVIADNRMAEVAGSWDRSILAAEHRAISILDPEFDISATGFEIADIEVLLDGAIDDPAEDPAPRPQTEAVSQLGDLWMLGQHKLHCSDARDPAAFETLLGEERADLVIGDSPYNVPINGHVVRRGRHREFVMASGEMSEPDFKAFLTQIFANLIQFSRNGSIHYLWIDWRNLKSMIAAIEQYTEMKTLIAWDKQTAGLGALYRSQHELVFVMKNGTARHINNVRLGEKGRHRTNIWSYPGLSGFSKDRAEHLPLHPTPRPIAMLTDLMRDCSKPRDIILDCFAGSGTTLVAAERMNRRARLIELDPLYVDVCIRRWQDATGESATHQPTGRSFNDLQAQRVG